jgi:putative DNA primase/helicase
MRNAPNVKALPKDKFTEAIIFVGADAWIHAKDWQENNRVGDNVPPIIIGPKQLDELDKINIIDDGRRYARVYRAGYLTETQISKIATRLALAGVQDARFYSESHELLENWTPQLFRLKEEAEKGELVMFPDIKKNPVEKSGDELAPRVESRAGGLYWVTPKIDRQSGEVIRPGEWLGDQMRTSGIGNDGSEAYLIIEMTPEGTEKTIYEAMPRNEIGMPAGWSRLRGRGVSITTSTGLLNKLAEYLQRQGDRTLWEVTSTAGWHCGAYVMPDGEVIGIPERPVAFCGGSAAIKGYVVRGTAEEWRDNVASLMRGNHSMMLGALVGLAAPLNSLTGGGCFGIHLFAQSSAGKTTTVEAATSLYGDPEMLKLSWDATRHGLTVEAAARNDGFIPIDEIGQGGKVNEVAQSAYSLFNGVGRIQGRKEGGNRAVMRWKIAALSTGEEDFETFLMKGGIIPKAGQLVRLLSVPFTDTTDFNGYDDGDEHARAIKRLSSSYCGAAGRSWVRWLSENKEVAIATIVQKEKYWSESLPGNASPQVQRVASRFAMLDAAGELAGNITGWTAGECLAATKQAFDDWLQDFGLENREKYQVISRARDFIQRHALSRFQPYAHGKSNGDMDRHSAARISNLAGYLVSGRRDDGKPEYHIIPSVFDDEILCGIARNFGCKALDDVGMMVCAEPGRWATKTIKVNGSQQRFIVLTDQSEDE